MLNLIIIAILKKCFNYIIAKKSKFTGIFVDTLDDALI